MKNIKDNKIGTSKITVLDKGAGQRAMMGFEWGLYFWKLPSGHLFKDEEGRLLNIPSIKGDLSKMSEIRKAANHYGQPEGEPWFYAGINRATDEEFDEQVDRMKQGLLPNMNDLGAVHAAKQTLKQYGDAE
jgi:hypothetical protein